MRKKQNCKISKINENFIGISWDVDDDDNDDDDGVDDEKIEAVNKLIRQHLFRFNEFTLSGCFGPDIQT